MAKKIEPDFSGEAGPALHSARWRFGPFELDETSRELRRGGVVMTIEAKPLNMLMLFLRNPGELVTKDELLDKLWTGRIVGEAVIGNCVTRLRQVLGEEASGWLRSIHGFGYRFDGPVQLIEDERATAAAAPKLDFQPGDQPPLRPNWQLLRRLGNSGDSWLAEHTKTRARRVFKFTSEAAGLSALKREVTVYRLLRESSGEKIFHVDLLDWNFDAPPWFVETEYCPGGSLQEWFETQGGVAKVPLATRLDLIAQIADALAEVHAVGVLHKDLKPANVFVVMEADGKPSIRLADFGASRLLDPARLAALEITRLGFTQVIENNGSDNSGTPLYLAPELLAGHPATVRADIYALGVMLYQFVIGNLRRQLTPGWEAEVEDEILRSDIAAAAEGNPERRLGDASELARNLRRLQARRVALEAERAAAEKAERAARALERIKARRVGVMAAFAALAIGFVVSATQYVSARRAKDVAEHEALRARSVSEFLAKDLFAKINTSAVPVKDVTVEQLLNSASEKIESRFANQPETAADIHSALGESYLALELAEGAMLELDKALTLNRKLYGDGSVQTLRNASRLVPVKFAMGELFDALPELQVIASAGMRSLGRGHTAVVELRKQLAWSEFVRGNWHVAVDQLQDLHDDYEAAHFDDDELLAEIELSIGQYRLELCEYSAAERILNSALVRTIKLNGPQHARAGAIHRLLGRIATENEQLDVAEKELQIALDIARHWGKSQSGALLSAENSMARLRIEQDRADEAIEILTDVARRSGDTGRGMQQDVHSLRLLAKAYQWKGMLPEAAGFAQKAVDSGIRSHGADNLLVHIIRVELADILVEGGDFEKARIALKEPVPVDIARVGHEHPAYAELLQVKGMLWKHEGAQAEAREALTESLRIRERIYGNDSIRTLKLRTEIASIFR